MDATAKTERLADGQWRITVRRSFAAGVAPATAFRVWSIVSNFGGLKQIFPSLVRLYLSYPDATDTEVGTIRDMAFDPGPGGGKLNFGVEQLESIDHGVRRLAYVSVLGMPVTAYRSGMAVSGEDACELSWISTFRPMEGQETFAEVLAGILVSGANQIAIDLGVD